MQYHVDSHQHPILMFTEVLQIMLTDQKINGNWPWFVWHSIVPSIQVFDPQQTIVYVNACCWTKVHLAEAAPMNQWLSFFNFTWSCHLEFLHCLWAMHCMQVSCYVNMPLQIKLTVTSKPKPNLSSCFRAGIYFWGLINFRATC